MYHMDYGHETIILIIAECRIMLLMRWWRRRAADVRREIRPGAEILTNIGGGKTLYHFLCPETVRGSGTIKEHVRVVYGQHSFGLNRCGPIEFCVCVSEIRFTERASR
jgi:hypothetical protein